MINTKLSWDDVQVYLDAKRKIDDILNTEYSQVLYPSLDEYNADYIHVNKNIDLRDKMTDAALMLINYYQRYHETKEEA